jgi:beta-lactamase regulating signal transducer with metallopeptidase domain
MSPTISSAATGLVSLAVTTLLHATALALVARVVCSLFGRWIRPSLQAAIWTVVLLKFFVPPVLPGEISLSGGIRNALRVRAPVRVESVPPSPRESAPLLFLRTAPAPSVTPRPGRALPAGVAEVLLLLYGFAFLVFVPRSLAISFRTWRRVRRLPAAPGDVALEVLSLARRIGLRRAPPVRTSEDATTPFVAGFLRPVLVLPVSVLERTDARSREPLLLHELAHLRRGDLVTRSLQNAARLLFFFWPPVWWVCRAIERAAEIACDEWALAHSAVPPRVYAATLLDVVRRREDASFGTQALALARNGRFIQERFEMILKNVRPRSPRLSLLAVTALLGWVAFSLAGGAAEPKKETSRKELVMIRHDGGPAPAVVVPRWAGLLLLQPAADTDGDGELNDEEVMAYASSRSAAEKAYLFKIAPEADDDGSGQLEAHEIYQLLDECLNTPFSRPPRPSKVNPPEADTNGDGRITEQEAREYVKNRTSDEPVQFEWTEESNADGKKSVNKKVMRIDGHPKSPNR